LASQHSKVVWGGGMKKKVIRVNHNEFFVQDKRGTVWWIRRTAYKEIPIVKIDWNKIF